MESNVVKSNVLKNNPIVKTIGAQRMVVFMAAVLLFVVFALVSEPFRQYTTMVSIIENSYYVGFMAIGVTFCLITGGVDLSVGTGMIAYALMGAYMHSVLGFPIWISLLACIVFGVIIGTFNGFLVAVLDLPPFIATLCSMMITRGVGSIFTTGQAASWPAISQPGGEYKALFRLTVNDTLIPIGVIYLIVAVIIMSLVLNRTKTGRYIIGIGSNKEALRLSGVNVVKWQWIAYIISGFFAGVAAISYAGIMSSSVPPGGGAGMELNAIGGAIIGGTSMKGGEGSVFGTMLGVLVMILLQVGLPFVGFQANLQQVITGIVLIIAVTFDTLKGKK